MSTYYAPAPSNKIRARDLFDGRLEKFGVREHVTADKTEGWKCLTDGRNYLEVYIDDDGFVSNLRRAGLNTPDKILEAIERAFDTDIFSEYEGQYWGFETQEEWDAWQDEEARKSAEEYYVELLKHLRGEPNDIRPGTVGMQRAEIAKKLVEKDSALLLPENMDKLLTEVDAIYGREHGVKVFLSPQGIAWVDMLFTHEDDLPRA